MSITIPRCGASNQSKTASRDAVMGLASGLRRTIPSILGTGNLATNMKTFTLDEALALLPVLESLLKRALESKAAAEAVEEQIAELHRRIYLAGGMRVDVQQVARQRAEMEAHMQRVRESVAEIDSVGVQVKDLEAGLLDFPCRMDEEVVLLCWRMGEPTIEHWHTVESGFQGRQPLDDRFRRRSTSGGNRPN